MSAIHAPMFNNGITDPYFSDVILLLHLNNNVTDNSSLGTVLARSGGTFITAPTGFDKEWSTGNAADNSGTNKIILGTPSLSYDLNGSDYFAIEAFVTVTTNMASGASASNVLALSTSNPDVNYGLTVRNNATGIYVSFNYIVGGGINGIVSTSSGKYLTLGQRYHIAATRSGNYYRLFVDGILAASVSETTRGTVEAKYIGIGAKYNGAYGFPGYIDEVRITNGTARYTTTFDIPTAPFPNS